MYYNFVQLYECVPVTFGCTNNSNLLYGYDITVKFENDVATRLSVFAHFVAELCEAGDPNLMPHPARQSEICNIYL